MPGRKSGGDAPFAAGRPEQANTRPAGLRGRRCRPHKKVVDIHPAVAYNINVAFCDRGGIGIRARLRGVSDKGTGSSPVDRTKQETHPAVVDVMTRGVFVI